MTKRQELLDRLQRLLDGQLRVMETDDERLLRTPLIQYVSDRQSELLEELVLDRGIQEAEESMARYWEQILNSNDSYAEGLAEHEGEKWERLMEWVDEQSLDTGWRSNIAVWIR